MFIEDIIIKSTKLVKGLGLIIPNLLKVCLKFLNFAAIQQDVLSFLCPLKGGLRRGKSGQHRAPDFREEDVREGIDSGEENNRPFTGVRVRR